MDLGRAPTVYCIVPLLVIILLVCVGGLLHRLKLVAVRPDEAVIQ